MADPRRLRLTAQNANRSLPSIISSSTGDIPSDTTAIDLCLSVFSWAKFRKAKGAIELHIGRWKIELFFKWIKQNMKIKTFLGISQNAVLTQTWIAFLCLSASFFLQIQNNRNGFHHGNLTIATIESARKALSTGTIQTAK